MIEYLSSPEIWLSFLTLSLLEIVLGIDNVIFISIVANRLQGAARARARCLGLALALIMRVAFLASIVWLARLVEPIFEYNGFAPSWRDVILFAGGLFLLVKATLEIHDEVENKIHEHKGGGSSSFAIIVSQIVLLDLVFSVDSVITAVGLVDELPVMIAAVVVAILVMLLAAGPVSEFIEHHPTTKMLALAFLLLVGVALVADAFHFHIPRGYLYFAIAFSLLVELLNILARGRREPAPKEQDQEAGKGA